MILNSLSDFTRVVVIDDNREDGSEIRDALSRQNIPALFIHIQNRSSLPQRPFQNIRLVFLDLELIQTGGDRAKANVTLTYLNSVIGENSFYILVLWSSHIGSQLESEFKSLLSSRFQGIQPCVNPIIITKQSCKNTDGKYSGSKIKHQINKKLETIKNYGLFIKWENIVEDSISQFLSKILLNEGRRELSKKIHALAQAYAGKKYTDDISKQSLLAINEAMKGSIDSNIAKENFIEHNKNIYVRVARLDKNKAAILNSQLSLNPDKTLGPGCVFKSESKFGNLVKGQTDESIKVAIDVTPICDIAQSKNEFHYYLHGILTPDTSKVKQGNYIYEFRNIFKYNNVNHKIVLNLRTLESIKKGQKNIEKRTMENGESVVVLVNNIYSKEKDILFKFRDNIVLDFQHKIASYNSRPGHILL